MSNTLRLEASTDLVGFIDMSCWPVEDHFDLLSCIVIYDV